MSRMIVNGVVAAAVSLLALPGVAQESSGPVAAVSVGGGGVTFQPLISDYASLTLTVAGPGGFVFEKSFSGGSYPSFSTFDGHGELMPDGIYTWELVASPRLAKLAARKLSRMRQQGSVPTGAELAALGIPPRDQLVQSGTFRLERGGMVASTGTETEETGGGTTGDGSGPAPSRGFSAPAPTPLDVVINDDHIVTFSQCIGTDCVNGENFGFDTLRLKENNLRIHFNDTSNSSSFPTTDWRIVINDTTNGGASYFAIEDSDAGRQVLRVDAGAPANSLRVDSAGDVGIGKSNPVVELHVADGDSPTLRLEQDGSSGFTPQTWDMVGNEANFFIRDVTNGSQLPFRIKPGADTDALFIDADNDVGLGTASPIEALHVRRTTGEANLRLETTAAAATEFQLANAGGEWQFIHGAGGAFNLNRVGIAGNQFVFSPNGSLVIQGSLTASGGAVFPDYVFEPGYERMPLGELSEFVRRERHLPGVMSRDEVREKGGIDVTRLQLQLLEKIEELTLHILEQQEKIERLEAMHPGADVVDEQPLPNDR